jgi:hypothetical protein
VYSRKYLDGHLALALGIYDEAGANAVYIPWLIFTGSNSTIGGGVVGQYTTRGEIG